MDDMVGSGADGQPRRFFSTHWHNPGTMAHMADLIWRREMRSAPEIEPDLNDVESGWPVLHAKLCPLLGQTTLTSLIFSHPQHGPPSRIMTSPLWLLSDSSIAGLLAMSAQPKNYPSPLMDIRKQNLAFRIPC